MTISGFREMRLLEKAEREPEAIYGGMGKTGSLTRGLRGLGAVATCTGRRFLRNGKEGEAG